MYKQIDFGKIDLFLDFLRSMSTNKIAWNPRDSLISPSIIGDKMLEYSILPCTIIFVL